MVFMLFCDLLFNSIIAFKPSDFIVFFSVPLLIILTMKIEEYLKLKKSSI